jgi:hypothetical protein
LITVLSWVGLKEYHGGANLRPPLPGWHGSLYVKIDPEKFQHIFGIVAKLRDECGIDWNQTYRVLDNEYGVYIADKVLWLKHPRPSIVVDGTTCWLGPDHYEGGPFLAPSIVVDGVEWKRGPNG